MGWQQILREGLGRGSSIGHASNMEFLAGDDGRTGGSWADNLYGRDSGGWASDLYSGSGGGQAAAPELPPDLEARDQAASQLDRDQQVATGVGLDDPAGEPPQGIVSRAFDILHRPLSTVLGFGSGLAGVEWDDQFEEDEKSNVELALRRAGAGLQGEEQYTWQDSPLFETDDDDPFWQRAATGVGAFAADVATDPLTYVSFGGTVLGKAAGSQIVQRSARDRAREELGESALRQWSQRARARRTPERARHADDPQVREAAERQIDELEPPRDWLERGGTREQWEAQLGADQFGDAAAEAYQRGGPTGLRRWLRDQDGAGLDEDTAERMFARLPRDVQGGLRIRRPFDRRGPGRTPRTVGIGGGGRIAERIGMADRLEGLHRQRNRLRGSTIGRSIADNITGRHGRLYGQMVRDFGERSPDDLARITYSDFRTAQDVTREGERTGKQWFDATQRTIGNLESTLRFRHAGDEDTARDAFRRWFEAPDDLDAVTADARWTEGELPLGPQLQQYSDEERAGIAAAREAHDFLRSSYAQLRQTGVDIGRIDSYVPRIMTMEESLAKARQKPTLPSMGRRAGQASYRPTAERRQYVEAYTDFDPATGEPVLRTNHLTPTEANEASGRNVFETDPTAVIAAYGDAARRLAVRHRIANALHEHGALAGGGMEWQRVVAGRPIEALTDGLEESINQRYNTLRQLRAEAGRRLETLQEDERRARQRLEQVRRRRSEAETEAEAAAERHARDGLPRVAVDDDEAVLARPRRDVELETARLDVEQADAEARLTQAELRRQDWEAEVAATRAAREDVEGPYRRAAGAAAADGPEGGVQELLGPQWRQTRRSYGISGTMRPEHIEWLRKYPFASADFFEDRSALSALAALVREDPTRFAERADWLPDAIEYMVLARQGYLRSAPGAGRQVAPDVDDVGDAVEGSVEQASEHFAQRIPPWVERVMPERITEDFGELVGPRLDDPEVAEQILDAAARGVDVPDGAQMGAAAILDDAEAALYRQDLPAMLEDLLPQTAADLPPAARFAYALDGEDTTLSTIRGDSAFGLRVVPGSDPAAQQDGILGRNLELPDWLEELGWRRERRELGPIQKDAIEQSVARRAGPDAFDRGTVTAVEVPDELDVIVPPDDAEEKLRDVLAVMFRDAGESATDEDVARYVSERLPQALSDSLRRTGHRLDEEDGLGYMEAVWQMPDPSDPEYGAWVRATAQLEERGWRLAWRAHPERWAEGEGTWTLLNPGDNLGGGVLRQAQRWAAMRQYLRGIDPDLDPGEAPVTTTSLGGGKGARQQARRRAEMLDEVSEAVGMDDRVLTHRQFEIRRTVDGVEDSRYAVQAPRPHEEVRWTRVGEPGHPTHPSARLQNIRDRVPRSKKKSHSARGRPSDLRRMADIMESEETAQQLGWRHQEKLRAQSIGRQLREFADAADTVPDFAELRHSHQRFWEVFDSDLMRPPQLPDPPPGIAAQPGLGTAGRRNVRTAARARARREWDETFEDAAIGGEPVTPEAWRSALGSTRDRLTRQARRQRRQAERGVEHARRAEAGAETRATQAAREREQAHNYLEELDREIERVALDRDELHRSAERIFAIEDVNERFEAIDALASGLVDHYRKLSQRSREAARNLSSTAERRLAREQAAYARRLEQQAQRETRRMKTGRQEADRLSRWMQDEGLQAIGTRRPDVEATPDLAATPPELDMQFAPEVFRTTVERYWRASRPDSDIQGWIDNVYRPYFALFKLFATVARGPGYVARNTIGGMWNNYLRDVSPDDHRWSARLVSARRESWDRARREVADQLAAQSGRPWEEVWENLPAGQVMVRAEQILSENASQQVIADGLTLYDVHRMAQQQDIGWKDSRVFEAVHTMLRRQSSDDLVNPQDARFWQAQTVGRTMDETKQPPVQLWPDSDNQRLMQRLANQMADNWWVEVSKDWARTSEDFIRHAAFIRGLREYGTTDNGRTAAVLSRGLHFDYQDLSDFERDWLRGTLIPFYVWTRHNVPLQFRALFREPGKMNRIQHAQQAGDHIFGGDEDVMIPEWMQERFGFATRLGWGQTDEGMFFGDGPEVGWGFGDPQQDPNMHPLLFGLETPAYDLNRFVSIGSPSEMAEGAARSVTEMVGPGWQQAMELATGVDSFTGAPFPDQGVEAPFYMRWLDAATPGDLTWEDQEGVQRAAAGPVSAVEGAAPPLGQVRRLVGDTEQFRERLPSSWLSLLAAQPGATYTPRQQAGEMRARSDRLRSQFARDPVTADQARELLDQGLTPEQVRFILSEQ